MPLSNTFFNLYITDLFDSKANTRMTLSPRSKRYRRSVPMRYGDSSLLMLLPLFSPFSTTIRTYKRRPSFLHSYILIQSHTHTHTFKTPSQHRKNAKYCCSQLSNKYPIRSFVQLGSVVFAHVYSMLVIHDDIFSVIESAFFYLQSIFERCRRQLLFADYLNSRIFEHHAKYLHTDNKSPNPKQKYSRNTFNINLQINTHSPYTSQPYPNFLLIFAIFPKPWHLSHIQSWSFALISSLLLLLQLYWLLLLSPRHSMSNEIVWYVFQIQSHILTTIFNSAMTKLCDQQKHIAGVVYLIQKQKGCFNKTFIYIRIPSLFIFLNSEK